MSSNREKWMILGGLAFAGAVVLTVELMRHRKAEDPLIQANRLIARCNDKITEIEQSVAGLQSAVHATA
jgi:hypothetical protein